MKIGRGTEEGVQIGPLINDDAVDKAVDLVGNAVERGAKLRIGGTALDGDGTFFAPTVVTDVQPGSRILREEIFGPVVSVVTFETEEEAVPSPTTPSSGWSATPTPPIWPAASV